MLYRSSILFSEVFNTLEADSEGASLSTHKESLSYRCTTLIVADGSKPVRHDFAAHNLARTLPYMARVLLHLRDLFRSLRRLGPFSAVSSCSMLLACHERPITKAVIAPKSTLQRINDAKPTYSHSPGQPQMTCFLPNAFQLSGLLRTYWQLSQRVRRIHTTWRAVVGSTCFFGELWLNLGDGMPDQAAAILAWRSSVATTSSPSANFTP